MTLQSEDSAIVPESITIPLTEELRTSYESLSTRFERSIENTLDPDALTVLNDAKDDVDTLLKEDAKYRLAEDTGQFEIILDQVDATNEGLEDLKEKIEAIPKRIAFATDLLNGIEKVLPLV